MFMLRLSDESTKSAKWLTTLTPGQLNSVQSLPVGLFCLHSPSPSSITQPKANLILPCHRPPRHCNKGVILRCYETVMLTKLLLCNHIHTTLALQLSSFLQWSNSIIVAAEVEESNTTSVMCFNVLWNAFNCLLAAVEHTVVRWLTNLKHARWKHREQ